jgi:hypothetical protein
MPSLTANNPREVALATQRALPRLDRAHIPPGLETLGEPWIELLAELKRLMSEAVKARSAAESADLELLRARDRDAEAFEASALKDGEDPGRKHEAKALKAQDEAHRLAVGKTRAHNTIVKKIRAAFDGEPGDEAMVKGNAQLDADLKRLRESAEVTLGELATVLARAALVGSIDSTRKANHVSIRAKVPTPPEGERFLRELLDYDPREVLFGES